MFIVATGMVSPVGYSSGSACAAMRAGIARFSELPYVDNRGEPIIGSVVPGLDPALGQSGRLVEMLARSIVDCLGDEPQGTDTIPLLIGLAEPERPGSGASLGDTIVKRVEERLGCRFHSRFSGAICQGHTAGFESLRLAREIIGQSATPRCLITGVDSYVNAASLLWLEQQWRLKSASNSDGVIPGEAAAAVLVARSAEDAGEATGRIAGLGFAMERVHVRSDEPFLGLGLADAARQALLESGLQMHQIDFRLTDVSGEAYGFKEQALAEARLLRVHREESMPLWHSADSIGDTGAAAGICQVAIAHRAFQKGYAPGRNALCFTSAVAGQRAAAVVVAEGSAIARPSALL